MEAIDSLVVFKHSPFPELPPGTNGRFSRPPQHPSKAAAPQIPADQVPRITPEFLSERLNHYRIVAGNPSGVVSGNST